MGTSSLLLLVASPASFSARREGIRKSTPERWLQDGRRTCAADRDVVVAEASVRRGRLSEPQRFVSITGLIPAQRRGWYLELLASTWKEYQVTYSVGDVGDRMQR